MFKFLLKKDLDFTALEVAQLLGKEEAKALIKFEPKGYQRVFSINPQQFKTAFNVRYLSHLHIPSDQALRELIRNCPYLMRTSLVEEQQKIGRKYFSQIWQGYVADLLIKWVDEDIGYGLFADADLAEGELVGAYTGLVRRIYRKNPDPNGYCLHYPTRWWSWKYYVIDALNEGNELRFVNHSFNPNLMPVCFNDRGLLHHLFITSQEVKKGEQLLFNYGTDYWRSRDRREIR